MNSQRFPDRRPKPRKRVLFGGVVVFGLGKFTCNCKIRDLTSDGARIIIPAGQMLTSEVYLINLRSQCAYKSNVVSHREKEAGLNFISSVDLPTIAEPRLEYLKNIWSAHSDRVTQIYLGPA